MSWREELEFATSRHAAAEENLVRSALFQSTPAELQRPCFGCHQIGARHPDGSRGSCNFCHTGHDFRASAAREPEACTSCHTGEDYPQDQAYWTSKHGVAYASGRDRRVAPTCATCHQPRSYHGDDFGLTLGASGTGMVLEGESAPVPMRSISRQAFSETRAAMVSVCTDCHSARFAEESLAEADQLKRAADAMLRKAVVILGDLADSGSVARAELQAATDGRGVRLDPGGPGATALNRFYEMWRFDHAWVWKGAYHSSWSVANRRGLRGLTDGLRELNAFGHGRGTRPEK